MRQRKFGEGLERSRHLENGSSKVYQQGLGERVFAEGAAEIAHQLYVTLIKLIVSAQTPRNTLQSEVYPEKLSFFHEVFEVYALNAQRKE